MPVQPPPPPKPTIGGKLVDKQVYKIDLKIYKLQVKIYELELKKEALIG